MKRKKNKPLFQPYEIERSLRLRDVKFDNLLDAILSEMDYLDNKARMSLFRGVLLRLLNEYSSIAEVRQKSRSQDIMYLFRRQSSETQVEVAKDIYENVSEMIDVIKDKESLFRPVISRFVCMYTVFAASDKEGAKKCEILAKDLLRSKNNKPEWLVLSVLKKRALRRGEKIPAEELELLQKYTFGSRDIHSEKMESQFHGSIFLKKFFLSF